MTGEGIVILCGRAIERGATAIAEVAFQQAVIGCADAGGLAILQRGWLPEDGVVDTAALHDRAAIVEQGIALRAVTMPVQGGLLCLEDMGADALRHAGRQAVACARSGASNIHFSKTRQEQGKDGHRQQQVYETITRSCTCSVHRYAPYQRSMRLSYFSLSTLFNTSTDQMGHRNRFYLTCWLTASTIEPH